MPRRKNQYLSDGSDSDASASGGSDGGYNSQEDGDSRAERALFEQNRGNKRQKTNGRSGKDSAWEGIFGEGDDEGPRGGGRGVGSKRGGRGGSSSGRTDWTKPPSFVPTGSASTAQPTAPTLEELVARNIAEAANEEDEGEEEEDDSEDSDDSHSAPASPRIREDEDEDEGRGATAGLGGGARPQGFSRPAEDTQPPATAKVGRGGIGSSSRGGGRGGIGSASRSSAAAAPPLVEETSQPTSGTSTPRGGLGSSNAPPQSMAATSSSSTPMAFGRSANISTPSTTSGAPRAQRSFVTRASDPTPVATTPLTAAEAAHFAKIENDYGAKLLSKLGWAPGKGLGAKEDGRAVPVAAGRVLRGQGITSGVRTEDSKREARRKGEIVSDSEDEEAERKKGARRVGKGKQGKQGGEAAGEQSWKKQRKVKVKVEHKTYEQIVAEASDQAASGVGLVLDARSGEMKEVQSLAGLSLSNWTPTSDNMQLPELRHNLRLVMDATKADVDALAREGKTVVEKRKWAVREEHLARKRVEDAENRVARLERIQESVSAVSAIAAKPKAADSTLDPLAGFAESFTSLLSFKEEYRTMALDEVVVGAIAQTTKQAFADWDPLDISTDSLLQTLKRWRHAYNLPRSETDDSKTVTTSAHAVAGGSTIQAERVMTSWESLLWTLWLPRVRSSINNDWSAFHPHSAVVLLESWSPILPPFIRDNILDQLILPKVKKAVEEWTPKPSRSGKVRSLAGVIFPWLPLLGARMEDVTEMAKRRIRAVLRSWTPKDGVPAELEKWRKDMYSSSDWDKLMLQYVVPKLGHTLREDFVINPAKQDMVPLEEWVLPWHTLLRSSMFVHLLDAELFPKWIEILYVWLASPGCKPDEVASWFTWWKSRFPAPILEIRGVHNAFKQGLELMDAAMCLGSSAPDRLVKPVYKPLPATKSKYLAHSRPSSPAPIRLPAEPTGTTDPTEITFRSLAEEAAAARDLIFLPLGRSHAQTGKPLFRVAKSVDGKGGVTVYIGDNAVFVQGEDGGYRAVQLEEMIRRAGG